MKPHRPNLAVVAVIGLVSLSGCGSQQGERARSEAGSQSQVASQPAASTPAASIPAASTPADEPQPTPSPQPSASAEPSASPHATASDPPREPTKPADTSQVVTSQVETNKPVAAPTYRDRLVPGSLVKPVTELDDVLARGNKLVVTSGIDPPRHSAPVHDAMFTAAGRLLATLSQDGKLKISDATTGRLRHELSLPGHDRVRDGVALLAAAAHKPLVALASRNEIVLYDAESGKETRRIKQTNELNYASIRLTPDGDRLLALIHRKVFVWTLPGDDKPLEFDVPVALDRSLTLTPDGNSLVRGNGNSEVEFYDLATGKLRRAVKVAEKNIDCTAIDPTGTIFAVADTTEQITAVYDVATGAPRGKLSGECSNLSFHGSGLLLVSSKNAQLVHVGAKVLRQVGIVRTYRRDSCERMEASPDGTRLLIPGGNNERGLLYNLARTQEERTIAWSDSQLVFEITMSHDGRRLALYDTKTLRLLSWPEGETLALLQLPKQPHGRRSVEFSPDDTELLLAVGEYRGDLCFISIYSTRDLELLHEAKAPDEGFDDACFTPDAKSLLIFGDDKTYLWNIAEKRMADVNVPFVGKPFCWVGDAAKKNLRLVTSDDERMHVYSWPDRKEVRTWDAGHQSYALVPSPSGTMVVAYGDGKGSVRVWNLDEGKLVKDLVVDERHAGEATFSGDGKHLITISGSFEKKLKIWSCATWEVVAETSLGDEETATLTAARNGPEFFTSNYNNRDPGPRITRQWNVDTLLARSAVVRKPAVTPPSQQPEPAEVEPKPMPVEPAKPQPAGDAEAVNKNASGPAENVLAETDGPINAIAFSHNGKLAAWCTSSELTLYSRTERKVLAKVKYEQLHLGKPGVGFSPDDMEILLRLRQSVAIAAPLRRYSAIDLKPLAPVGPTEAEIDDVCYSPDGKSLFVFDQFDADVWSIAENRKTGDDLPVEGQRARLVRGTEGKPDRLFVSDNGRMRIYSWGDWKPLQTWHAGYEIANFAVSPDGSLAAVLSRPGQWITIWNTATGELVRELPYDDDASFDPKTEEYHSPFRTIAFSSDGRHLIAGGGSRLRIIACANWQTLRILKRKNLHLDDLQTAPRGPEFVAAHDFGVDSNYRASLWNLDELLQKLPPAPKPVGPPEPPATAGTPMFGLREDNEPVAFIADGKQIFTTGNYSKSAATDIATMKTVWEIETKEDWRAIAVSLDGSRLAATYGDDAKNDDAQQAFLKVWDTKSKQLVVDVKARTACLGAIEFSPDGATLAVGEGIARASLGGTVAFWDVATNKLRSQLPISRGLPTHLRYSRDAALLAFVESEQLSVWDLTANQLKHRLKLGDREDVRDLCFSADGKQLVVAVRPAYGEHDFGAIVVDTASGERLKLLDDIKSGIVSLDFTRKGDLLITAESGENWNRAYRARSWPEGKVLFEALHDNPRFDDGFVRLSPDGKKFIESAFGKAHVWNVEHLRDRQLQRELKLADRRDASVSYVGELPRLHYFEASDRTLDLVPELTQPFALSLGNTDGVTDAGLERLARLKNLARVELDGCEGITDAGLRRLVALPQLRQLKLAIEFTPTGLKNLAPLERLETLELWHHDLDDTYIAEILRFRRLKELRLVFAKLSPEGKERLKAGLPAGCKLIEGWE